jgi:ketosteroid isomerase-like protein
MPAGYSSPPPRPDGDDIGAPFAHLIKFADGKIARGELYSDSAKAAKVLA